MGGLKRKLYRVYIEDGDVLFVEPVDIGIKIRDMVRISDGPIVIFTDDKKIVYLEPGPGSFQYEKFQTLLAAETNLELRDATHQTFDSCLECHGLEENELASGPTLYRVCGRKPDTDSFLEYSGALSQSVDIWDQDSLARFVSDPNGTAPGTSMDWGGAGRPEVAALLTKTLCQLSVLPVE